MHIVSSIAWKYRIDRKEGSFLYRIKAFIKDAGSIRNMKLCGIFTIMSRATEMHIVPSTVYNIELGRAIGTW